MKVTYTADDGTEFNSSDECLAYEEDSGYRRNEWKNLLAEKYSELRELNQCISNQLLFGSNSWEQDHLWTYRRRFVELAKTFIEADPALKQLID